MLREKGSRGLGLRSSWCVWLVWLTALASLYLYVQVPYVLSYACGDAQYQSRTPMKSYD